jgi:hypothetical protein
MAKRKRTNNDLQSESKKNRQHNGQKKKDKQRSFLIVDRCLSFFFWPLCCLFFFDSDCRSLFVLFHDLQSETKKNRQDNVKKKKYKQRSTKHTHKTNDRVKLNSDVPEGNIKII